MYSGIYVLRAILELPEIPKAIFIELRMSGLVGKEISEEPATPELPVDAERQAVLAG